MTAVYLAVLLIERPSIGRHILCGAFVGLAAFFGRNLGLYSALSFVGLILFIWSRVDRHALPGRLAAWSAGIVLGYSPMLLMLILVRGMWDSFLDGLRLLAELGSTNIARSFPWPWQAHSLSEIALGLVFFSVPLFYVIAAAWIARADAAACHRHRILVGATFVGIPCLHYIFSRADVEHLAMNIHPALLALSAVALGAGGRVRSISRPLLAVFVMLSAIVAGGASPYGDWWLAPRSAYRSTLLGRWTVSLPRRQAALINTVTHIATSQIRPDEDLFIAPHVGPGLYALLNRESPVWQIYFTVPWPEWRQQRMIEDLERKNVRWALIGDERIDGREDLCFQNTHRLMFEYIMQKFEVVAVKGLPPEYRLFKRR